MRDNHMNILFCHVMEDQSFRQQHPACFIAMQWKLTEASFLHSRQANWSLSLFIYFSCTEVIIAISEICCV